MVIEEQKLFFRTAMIVNDPRAAEIAVQNKWSRVTVIGPAKLDLPGFTMREKPTTVIRFGASLEDTLATFNKTARNEIARTFRDPSMEFKTGPVSDTGYELYLQFERLLGRVPFPRRHFKACQEYIAYVQGAPVSGIFFYPTEPVVRIRSIFSARRNEQDRGSYQRIGFASRRLMLEVCRWGMEHGRTGLDLAGVNLNDEQKAGITQYKLSFGGAIIPEYTYSRRTAPYAFFERLMSVLRRA